MKTFPLQDGPAVPWDAIEPHRQQAQKNHGQTLEDLAVRGGLSCAEFYFVMVDRMWSPVVPRHVATKEGSDLAWSCVVKPLKDLEYIPGEWECAKCGFFQIKSLVVVSTGDLLVNTSETPDLCPNCDEALQRVKVINALRDLRAEMNSQMDFNGLASKLLHKREKKFIVIAEDEPYYLSTYRIIRQHEMELGRWTEEDEVAYQDALGKGWQV